MIEPNPPKIIGAMDGNVSIEVIPKKKMIYYNWFAIEGKNGRKGVFAWRHNKQVSWSRASEVNIDYVDDDLKEMQNIVAKSNWIDGTMPSCSGHFVDEEKAWRRYSDQARDMIITPRVVAEAVDKKDVFLMTKIEMLSLTMPDDYVADCSIGLFGFVFDSTDQSRWFKVADLERAVNKKKIEYADVVRMPFCAKDSRDLSMHGVLIIVDAPNRLAKKETWSRLTEIAKEVLK